MSSNADCLTWERHPNPPHPCESCGQVFQGDRASQKFCSLACRITAKKYTGGPKRCPDCGVEHQPRPWQIKARTYTCQPCRIKRTVAWRKRVPVPVEKQRARTKLQTAVRWSGLTRQPCATCGEQKVEAHHDDYSRPLDVVWLCGKHHRMRHGRQS